jgi:hypothetical protein
VVPILLDGLAVADYETRCWAAGGLQVVIDEYRESEWREISKHVFAQARPALARILQSENEPSLLRVMALGMFVSNMGYDANGAPLTRTGLYPGAQEDLIAALQTREKQGFRYTTVDMLTQYFSVHPDELPPFAQALQPMLDDAAPEHRALAAYALASWPGDKQPEIKRELLREIRERSTHSYRAARALGSLGRDAADAVPELLIYADATKSWTPGYASSALEAARRLKPELRPQYPEIDQKLKLQEAPRSQSPPRQVTLGEWLASLPQNDELAQELRTELRTEAEQPPLIFANLILDARVLLVEKENANRVRIEAVLAEFASDAKMHVTAENYSKLAHALSEVDPQFQAEWRKMVLVNYPWLDRVVPREKP